MGGIISVIQLLHPLLVVAVHLQAGLVLLRAPVPPPMAHHKGIVLPIACAQRQSPITAWVLSLLEKEPCLAAPFHKPGGDRSWSGFLGLQSINNFFPLPWEKSQITSLMLMYTVLQHLLWQPLQGWEDMKSTG